MIISEHDGRLRIVTQNDHAHLAAEMLSLWCLDGLPDHPRRHQILTAAREHDNGWQEADSAPRCDVAGRPLDFVAVPQDVRREIWRRGIERFRERDAWVTLLILQHAIQLHRSLADDPDWSPWLAEWRELRHEMLEECGAETEDLISDYRFIELSDLLSLGLCAGWQRTAELLGYRLVLEPDAVALEPFPFAGATTFRVTCRFIEDRSYSSDTDLGVELASARWQKMEFRVAAAG